ncbi:MAG: FecR domain-containing protein [Bacteroidetes bacterium]|nr:FecR domain-containing protein [Bacteroidota bacterium]
MKKETGKELLVKFLENRCSREEAEVVHAWLEQHPDALDQWLDEQEWEQMTDYPRPDTRQSDAMLSYIQAHREPHSVWFRRPWLRVAAIFVLLLAGGATLYHFLKPSSQPVQIVSMKSGLRPATREKMYVNNHAESIADTLDDGTIVHLSKNSLLSCNQPFDTDKRELRLQGEAVFYVAKDKQRPFTVIADGFSTTALGTVFRVSAYTGGTASVKLVNGKVVVRSLQSAASPVYLLPGDACTFSESDHRLHYLAAKSPRITLPAEIKVDGDIRETEDEIAFSNTPLQQVLGRIGSLYHTSIHFDSTHAKGRTFTGSFLKTQPLEEVIATIAQLNNLTVSKEPAGCRLQED